MLQPKESATAVLDTPVDERFYHVGLLPAPGDVLFPVQTRDSKEMSLKSVDSWKLFSDSEHVGGLEKGIRIFVAKARQFLGLAVRGMHFPSTTEYV